ncbi:unannotated protein [freshwater metagenome]|uniref:Unannotated protein n=1 Tax=freshwater metagenome TaxID=449393 RepID=A0A6J6I352_9ZZZZ
MIDVMSNPGIPIASFNPTLVLVSSTATVASCGINVPVSTSGNTEPLIESFVSAITEKLDAAPSATTFTTVFTTSNAKPSPAGNFTDALGTTAVAMNELVPVTSTCAKSRDAQLRDINLQKSDGTKTGFPVD